MLDEPQDIADLEAEIEALRDEADRSRKLTIVAKLVIVAGAVMLPVSFLVSSPTALVMGIAASLGSVALFGSNERTLSEVGERISHLEARRSELIDRLALQEVAPASSRSALEVRSGDLGGAAGAEASSCQRM
jgi:hypothetical protein